MAITGADAIHRLAIVRRLEAAGFRAFPAATTAYDGTWAIRLTEGYPAKRLNSVNPLDPSDHSDIPARIARAAERFAACRRPLLFRQSPLAPPALIEHLDAANWSSFGECALLTADLDAVQPSVRIERIPIHDPARYVAASLLVHGEAPERREGLLGVIGSIRPPTALFVQEAAPGAPIAVAFVVHDKDLAGFLDLGVSREWQRQGIARDLVANALRFAALKGVKTVWLQVEIANTAALRLYEGFGFREAYRYRYRAPPQA